MSFGTPYPYGTPGGDEVIVMPQTPPVIRVARGNSVIVFLHVNGRLAERLRENVEDVVRILGLTGDVIVAIIVREDNVVRDSNAGDISFDDGIVVTQLGPGVVSVTLGNNSITNAMLQNAIITAAEIAAGAVLNGHLGNNVVDARVIAPATITATEIAPGVITPPGLELISEDTLSGTSKSVNSVFSAAFDRYLIEGVVTLGTVSFGMNFRFRASGADNSANSYINMGMSALNPGSSPTNAAIGGTATSFPIILAASGGQVTNMQFRAFIDRPANAAVATTILAESTGLYSGLTYGMAKQGLYHGVAAAFDGFTLFSSASLTGVVRTYGLRNTP